MNRGGRSPIKFQVPEDAVLDYKNYTVLQKFLNERGKIIPRRITGLSAKRQRALASAVKRARFLGLLPTGGGLKI